MSADLQAVKQGLEKLGFKSVSHYSRTLVGPPRAVEESPMT
jgi:hypothetical protein